jgi:hypothetical protein
MVTAWLFIGPLQLYQTAREEEPAGLHYRSPAARLSPNGMTLAREDGGVWE